MKKLISTLHNHHRRPGQRAAGHGAAETAHVPHETISAVIDGNRVTVTYGRPYTKNPRTGEVRKIWGGLVPYGKPWRMGADEATLLITQQPIVMGGEDHSRGRLHALHDAAGKRHVPTGHQHANRRGGEFPWTRSMIWRGLI